MKPGECGDGDDATGAPEAGCCQLPACPEGRNLATHPYRNLGPDALGCQSLWAYLPLRGSGVDENAPPAAQLIAHPDIDQVYLQLGWILLRDVEGLGWCCDIGA